MATGNTGIFYVFLYTVQLTGYSHQSTQSGPSRRRERSGG